MSVLQICVFFILSVTLFNISEAELTTQNLAKEVENQLGLLKHLEKKINDLLALSKNVEASIHNPSLLLLDFIKNDDRVNQLKVQTFSTEVFNF